MMKSPTDRVNSPSRFAESPVGERDWTSHKVPEFFDEVEEAVGPDDGYDAGRGVADLCDLEEAAVSSPPAWPTHWEQLTTGRFVRYNFPSVVMERLVHEAVVEALPEIVGPMEQLLAEQGTLSVLLPRMGRLIESKLIARLRHLAWREERALRQSCESY